MLQSFSTIALGAAASFYLSWHLTIVAIVFVPVVVAACFFESRWISWPFSVTSNRSFSVCSFDSSSRYMATSNMKEKRAIESGCRLAVEAITQIRTVASLGHEPHVIKRFNEEMATAEVACRKKVRYRGLVFSFGQAMPFFGYALCIGYGGYLVADDYLPYKDVIKWVIHIAVDICIRLNQWKGTFVWFQNIWSVDLRLLDAGTSLGVCAQRSHGNIGRWASVANHRSSSAILESTLEAVQQFERM